MKAPAGLILAVACDVALDVTGRRVTHHPGKLRESRFRLHIVKHIRECSRERKVGQFRIRVLETLCFTAFARW